MSVKKRGERVRQGLKLPTESHVQQNQSAIHDINSIVARYKQTGEFPVSSREPIFTETDIVDLGQDLSHALEKVAIMREAFMRESAEVRELALNDPGVFQRMYADPEGRHELIEAGLDAEEHPNFNPTQSQSPEPAAQPATGGTEAPDGAAPSDEPNGDQ